MRCVVLGLGAVGGTVAAALALAGQPAVGIARGRMLDAMRAEGLRLRTPEAARLVRKAARPGALTAGLEAVGVRA